MVKRGKKIFTRKDLHYMSISIICISLGTSQGFSIPLLANLIQRPPYALQIPISSGGEVWIK